MRNFLRIAFILIIAVAGGMWFWMQQHQSMQVVHEYRIAIITRKDVTTYEQAIKSYRSKMAKLGYVEGKNISYDVHPYSDSAELKNIVRDVIASHADLILTYSTPATVEAYSQTKMMSKPTAVVFGSMGDPLAAGVVHDIQRPGTHVTGVASLSTELTANRIRLLKDINPVIKRIAMPHSAAALNDGAANKSVDIAEEIAQQLGITLVLFPVSSKEENQKVAQQITKEKSDGMIVGGDSLVWGNIDLYITQAIKEKIPLAAFDLTQITKGALIGIGPDYSRAGEQAAALTHQILNGTDPGTIAVQVPQKLILAINLVTARAIGITLSDDLLKRADVIIGK